MTRASRHARRRRGADLVLDLVENALGFRAFHAHDVILVFEQHAQRVVDRLRIKRDAVELMQRRHPVERFGNPRRLEQIATAQRLHKGHDLARQRAPTPRAAWF